MEMEIARLSSVSRCPSPPSSQPEPPAPRLCQRERSSGWPHTWLALGRQSWERLTTKSVPSPISYGGRHGGMACVWTVGRSQPAVPVATPFEGQTRDRCREWKCVCLLTRVKKVIRSVSKDKTVWSTDFYSATVYFSLSSDRTFTSPGPWPLKFY